MSTLKWVSWMLIGPSIAQTERSQINPDAYYTRLHVVDEGVGWYEGRAGWALCGVKIPADNPNIIHSWRDDSEGGRKCSRCLARMKEQ